ncbi:Armadillo-type fold [Phytophthora cactorum]|nr:Armadillo-type fold [Phytophthora cactorum]
MGQDSAYVVVLYYKYVRLCETQEELEAFAAVHEQLCSSLGLTGRVRLALEGINGTLGGSSANVQSYVDAMKQQPQFVDVDWKTSSSQVEPFPELQVRVVAEIVALELPDDAYDLSLRGKHLTPEQFRSEQLSSDPESIALIDVRNTYEFNVGHFTGALNPRLVASDSSRSGFETSCPCYSRRAKCSCTARVASGARRLRLISSTWDWRTGNNGRRRTAAGGPSDPKTSLVDEWRAHEEDCAARVLQNVFRAFLSRQRMARLLLSVYEKHYDPIRKQHYYVNTLTDVNIVRGNPYGSGIIGRFCGILCVLTDGKTLADEIMARSAQVTCNYADERVAFPILLAADTFFAGIKMPEDSARLQPLNGATIQPQSLTKKAHQPHFDFALCALNEDQFVIAAGDNVRPLRFEMNDRKLGCAESESLRMGEHLEIVGHPHGKLQALYQRQLARLAPNSINPQHLQYDRVTETGSAGCGVFTRGGKLLGIQQFSGPKELPPLSCWYIKPILNTALTLQELLECQGLELLLESIAWFPDEKTTIALTLRLFVKLSRLQASTQRFVTETSRFQVLCDLLRSHNETVQQDGAGEAEESSQELPVVLLCLELVGVVLSDNGAAKVAFESCSGLSWCFHSWRASPSIKWEIAEASGFALLQRALLDHRQESRVLYWALITFGNVAYGLDESTSRPQLEEEITSLALIDSVCQCRVHFLSRLHELELSLVAAQAHLDHLHAIHVGEETRNELDASTQLVDTLTNVIADWKANDVAEAADYALRYLLTEEQRRVQAASKRLMRKFLRRTLSMAVEKWSHVTEFERHRVIFLLFIHTVRTRQLRPAFRRWEQTTREMRKHKSILQTIGSGLAMDLTKKKKERYRMLVLQK